jgi:hypothetical protein
MAKTALFSARKCPNLNCLYSSNFGTFWLKIEQFWPFEEISIFSNSSHLEWKAMSSNFNCSYMARSSLAYIPVFL